MRMLFTKEGVAIWSSHLDLMRALMRSFRRAGIDLKHSQGFTPHPELSILMPLSVGVESQCEIAEFTLAEGCALSPGEIVSRLNPVLPAGIRALDCWEGGMKAGKLAWLRARLTLRYEATGNRQQATGDGGTDSSAPPVPACRDGSQPSAAPGFDEAAGSRQQATGDGGTDCHDQSADLSDGPNMQASAQHIWLPELMQSWSRNDRIAALRAFFARPSLVVEKHGKKGPVEQDIAPMIRELTVSAAGAVIGRPEEGSGIRDQASGDGENGFLASLEMTGDGGNGFLASLEMTGGDAVVVEAVVAAQNPTLNPMLLVTAIETYLPEYKPEQVRCRRIEIYDADGKPFR